MQFKLEMRGLAKDATIYGLSSAVGRMANLFLAPILTRIFLPADYGVIALVQLAVGFFIVIAGMNIGSGMTYHYYKQDDASARKTILTTGLLVTALIAAVIALALAWGAEPMARLLQWRKHGPMPGYDLAYYLRIAAVGLFLSLMLTGARTILRLLRQPQHYMKTEFLGVGVQVVAVLVLVVGLKYGIAGVFWAGVIAPACGLLLALWYIRTHLAARFSRVFLGLIFAYCLPQMPGVLINWAQTQLGRAFLNYYASLSELGLYAIAYTVASVLIFVTSAFRMAYDPYALSIMKREDAKQVYARIYSYYGAVGCWLVGGIAAFAKPLLMLLTPPDYHAAYGMVIYFLVASFYMGANNILATGIWISEKTSHTSYAQAIAFAVLLAASALLVPWLGGTGAALAFMLGTLAQSFAYYAFAQRLWPVMYRFWRVHGLMLLVFALGLGHNAFVQDLDFSGSVAAACVTSLIVSLLVLMLGLQPGDRTALRQFRRRMKDGTA